MKEKKGTSTRKLRPSNIKYGVPQARKSVASKRKGKESINTEDALKRGANSTSSRGGVTGISRDRDHAAV